MAKSPNQAGNVVAIKQDARPTQRIQPLEGWTVKTAYGTLKTRAGVELVRLEDVHTWLCNKGEPAHDAVHKIFSPFYMACLSAAEDGDESALALPGRFHLLNALTWPSSLLIGANRSKVQAVNVFATGFPDLGHVRFSDGSIGGLVYSIAEGARRVWLGGADLRTDHLAAWQDRQERETYRKYKIKWPKDDDLRKLLGRVAVPIETAHELWSWGSVADVTRLRAVSSESEEPTNWSQLMAFRSAKPGTEWTQKQKGLAAQEAKRRKNSPGAKGIAKAMARELDITVTRLNGLIRSANEDNKRVAARGKAA